MTDNGDTVEMRGNVPRDVYDVFDAVRMARRVTKQALLSLIVEEWAAREIHVATVVGRVARGKVVVSRRDWEADGE